MAYEIGTETAYVDDAAAIGRMVRTRRVILGITQAELAQKAGVGRRFVTDLEAGKQSVQADSLFKVVYAVDLELLVKIPLHKQRMFSDGPHGSRRA